MRMLAMIILYCHSSDSGVLQTVNAGSIRAELGKQQQAHPLALQIPAQPQGSPAFRLSKAVPRSIQNWGAPKLLIMKMHIHDDRV